MDAANTPWWIVASSAVPSAAIGLWTFIQWWGARDDRRKEREQGAAEKREEGLVREREQISAQNASLLAALRADLDRCRDQLAAISDERFHGMDLARKWHDQAWEMRHQAIHARQMAESLARLGKQEEPIWPEKLDLPPFDKPD